MDAVGHEVNSWVTEAFGEKSTETSVWAQEDDFVQIFVRLSDKVAILSLSNDEGEIIEEDSLLSEKDNGNQIQFKPGECQMGLLDSNIAQRKYCSLPN